MFRIHWLFQFSQRWFPQRGTAQRRRTRRVSAATRRCVKPRLECLEDRTLLSGGITTTTVLISAINSANTSGGATTITLASGATFDFTSANNSTNGPNALPVITGNITIVGNGDTIERSTAAGTPAFRLFDVANGVSLEGGPPSEISRLTLQNLTLQGGLAQGSGTSAEGGAIYDQGNLTLDSVTVRNNTAQGSNGGNGGNGLGGGLYVASGTVSLNNDTLQNNHAVGGNGGYGGNGVIGYEGATGGKGGNGGDGMGGGMYVASGTISLTNDTMATNHAQGGNGGSGGTGGYDGGNGGSGGNGIGGGIYYADGTLDLSNDTLANNESQGGNGGQGGNVNYTPNGAALFGYPYPGTGGNGGNGQGGGLWAFVASATISLTNDTVAYNHAQGGNGGGGGNIAGGSPVASGSGGLGDGGGIYGNVYSLANTIIANNTASTVGPDFFGGDDFGGILENNLIGNTSPGGGFGSGSILNPSYIGLGTLAKNGGPTQTIALLAGSPAIDAGDSNVATSATDQRGYARIVGNAIDIGAYEYGSTPAASDLSVTETATASVGGQITFTLTVTNNSSTAQSNVILEDLMPLPANNASLTGSGHLVSWIVPSGWSSSSFPFFSGNTYNDGISASAWTASLAGNTSATFQLVFQAFTSTPASTILTNTASVGPLTGDPNPANNSTVLTVTTNTPNSVVAGNATVPFNAAGLTVPVSAVVTSPNTVVNQGMVTFAVLNNGTPVGTSVQAPVVKGQASATLDLLGLAPGTYTIAESYHDSTGEFSDSSSNGQLTVTSTGATIDVTSTSDTLNYPTTVTVAQLQQANFQNVTLRDAVNAANNSGGDNIIVLQQGAVYDLTQVDNNWYGPNALPAISSDITIIGNGATIQRDSASTTPAMRLFYVSGGLAGELSSPVNPGSPGNLTLQNLTLQNGLAQGGSSDGGGGGMGAGGAIFNQGELTIDQVTLTNDEAIGGSGNDSALGNATGGGGMGSNADGSGDGGGFGGTWVGGSYGGTGAPAGTSSAGGGGGFLTGANGQSSGQGGGLGGFGGGGGDGGNGGSGVGNGGNFGVGGAAAGGGGGVGGGGDGDGSGGFGSGGGSGDSQGGMGGFGGGGGAATNTGGTAGIGGFGGGSGNSSAGGGGLGAGGAIFNMGASNVSGSGSLTIIDSTLTGDTAQGGAGGLGGSAYGGAVFNLDGSLALSDDTLSENTVTAGGMPPKKWSTCYESL